MRKRFGILAALALTAALAASVGRAQDGTAGNIGVGRGQTCTGNTLALTGTPALLCTAVSGKAIRVLSISAGAGTATTINFFDGSGTGSPIGCPIYVPTTGRVIDQDFLGQGFATSVGNGLYVSGGTTVTIGVRIQKD